MAGYRNQSRGCCTFMCTHRHPRHAAVAPGSGEATLDSAPRSSKRWPAHPTGPALVGAAVGRRELLLGLSTHPGRTRHTRIADRGQFRLVDSSASRHRFPRARRAKLAPFPAGASPEHSHHRLLWRRHATAPPAVRAVRSRTRHPPRPPPRRHDQPQRPVCGLAPGKWGCDRAHGQGRSAGVAA
jgi:hypothetical protein